MHNQGPPDLEEWLKKAFKKVVPHKRTTLNSLIPPHEQKTSGVGTWLAIPFLVLAGLGMSGIITVKPNEAAVVERFGVYQTTLNPGMHWLIPFVDRSIVVSTDAQSASISGLILTKDHVLVNVNISINYNVVDAKNYAFASDHVASVLQAYLNAVSVQTFAQSNIADLLDKDNWAVLASTLQGNLSFVPATYGIQIQNITVNSVGVPDALSAAFNQKINAAQTQVKTMMDSAQQYKDSVAPLAAAQAAQLLSDANGQRVATLIAAKVNVAQFNALLPAYQKDPLTAAAYLPLAVSSAQVAGNLSSDSVSSNTTNAQSAYLRWQGANQTTTVSAGN